MEIRQFFEKIRGPSYRQVDDYVIVGRQNHLHVKCVVEEDESSIYGTVYHDVGLSEVGDVT